MKIAVPVTSDNNLDSHFGHCEYFNIYIVNSTGKADAVKRIPSTDGCGCKSGIASVLASEGVTVMLAGGIGNGAVNVLKNNGIEVIRGCSGSPDELVNLYAGGKLADDGVNCIQHDHHHSGHGSHSCNHN